MALIHCPECGKEISDKAKACPNCGYPMDGIASAEATAVTEIFQACPICGNRSNWVTKGQGVYCSMCGYQLKQ